MISSNEPNIWLQAQYKPSYLLCPETYTFQAFEKCKPKLDKNKYSRLEEDLSKEDEDSKNIQAEDINLLFKKQWLSYELYQITHKKANDREEVMQYARLVGKPAAQKLLLFRSEWLIASFAVFLLDLLHFQSFSK